MNVRWRYTIEAETGLIPYFEMCIVGKAHHISILHQTCHGSVLDARKCKREGLLGDYSFNAYRYGNAEDWITNGRYRPGLNLN